MNQIKLGISRNQLLSTNILYDSLSPFNNPSNGGIKIGSAINIEIISIAIDNIIIGIPTERIPIVFKKFFNNSSIK